MDIYQIKNFLILAETLNFRKASEQINIVQPALSRQIQVLEEQLGATLFDRSKRSVSLTEAGVFFRIEAERILQDFEKVIAKTAQLHRGEAGEIRIGHSSSAMQTVVPQLVLKIRDRFPNMKTFLLENSNIEQIEMLMNRSVDIALGPNLILPNEIGSRVLYREHFVVLLPENHPISAENFVDLSVFANETFILPPVGLGAGYVETVYQVCQQSGFKPNVVYESAHSAGVQRLVEAGLGISIEPISSVRGINMNIKLIELKDTSPKAEMMLLWLKEREQELERFLNLL
jgi:DNA-binding transcriptional LysR family regulator